MTSTLPADPVEEWHQRTVRKRLWLTEKEFHNTYVQREFGKRAAHSTKFTKLKKKHDQLVQRKYTVQSTPTTHHAKTVMPKTYRDLWSKNKELRDTDAHATHTVWVKNGLEVPVSAATPTIPKKTKVNNYPHTPNPISKAKQQCIGMECSLCHTNEHMVDDPTYGLICGNCRFELQCIKCRTMCSSREPSMEVVRDPPGVGEWFWRCRKCNVLIENYWPRLRCLYCKADPTPTNLSSNDQGVWQCLVCSENKDVCKNCKHGVLSIEVEHGNEFKVCKQCGYRCDELQLPDYMYSLTVGEMKHEQRSKPVTTKACVTGDLQQTDGKSVLRPKHYLEIERICQKAFRLLNMPQQHHQRTIKLVTDMVTVQMKNHNYRVDKHIVASLFMVLRRGESPVSRKQFDAILPRLHVPLRGEKPEEAHDETEDKSSALKSELTRSLKKIKPVSMAMVPSRNPWQNTEDVVEKFLLQDQVLLKHFEALPKADWGVMLKRGRYQVRYMHFVCTTQKPDAKVSKMVLSGYEHEVAGVCYYLTQLPLLTDRSQRVKGRTVKCKEQIRAHLQLRREPYYNDLLPMVEEDLTLWQLPGNLGLSRYEKLCIMLESYDYDYDYRSVARGVMKSLS